MTKLTKTYIDNHLETVHSYDSVGRNLAEHILTDAAAKVGAKGMDSVSGSIKYQATATSIGCIKITIETSSGWVFTFHVGKGGSDGTTDKK